MYHFSEKMTLGTRDEDGWFEVDHRYTVVSEGRLVTLKTQHLYTVLMFELDRRWARMRRSTYVRCASAAFACPYNLPHNQSLCKPPFYSWVESYWDPEHYRAWSAWTDKNMCTSTRQVVDQFAAVLMELGDTIDKPDLDRLYTGITLGVVTKRQK